MGPKIMRISTHAKVGFCHDSNAKILGFPIPDIRIQTQKSLEKKPMHIVVQCAQTPHTEKRAINLPNTGCSAIVSVTDRLSTIQQYASIQAQTMSAIAGADDNATSPAQQTKGKSSISPRKFLCPTNKSINSCALGKLIRR